MATNPSPLTLDQVNDLIRRCVHTKADQDYDLLYDSLFHHPLFLNITLEPDGTKKMGQLSVQGVEVAMFFTTSTVSALTAPFGSMAWRDVILMLPGTSVLDGCMIYNDTDDWVIFRTPYLLQRLPGTAHA